VEVTLPRNISAQDFKRLRSHVRANAMAVAVEAESRNNLERGAVAGMHLLARLLFPATPSGTKPLTARSGTAKATAAGT
jgi:hypothetical protein